MAKLPQHRVVFHPGTPSIDDVAVFYGMRTGQELVDAIRTNKNGMMDLLMQIRKEREEREGNDRS